MKIYFKKALGLISSLALVLSISATPIKADSVTSDFESYAIGSVNGQDGWTSLGSVGSGCAVYDHAVSPSLSVVGFGSQSLRVSDAVTSGCFGDNTFAKPLTDSVGEIDATNGTFSAGVKQSHFETQFDIASTVPGAQQPGMHVSISPDRGDGSRMSYLRFEDGVAGIDVFFDDVQGTTNPANFVETQIATGLDRSVKHTIKLTMDVKDGPSNDVVKVWIDGTLEITGTSWENYYRFDSESASEQSPRIVKTLIFRTSGTPTPANAGNGFLFDNLSLSSVIPLPPSVPVITSPANNATVTTSALTQIDWSDSTGTFSPFEYWYQAFSDPSYSSLIYSSVWLSASSIPTLGTPPGVYYVQVKARDANGVESAWSNDSVSPFKITVTADPGLVGPPTKESQCKKDGWKIFNNPTFKNQGQCVSYVEKHEHEHDHDKDHHKEDEKRRHNEERNEHKDHKQSHTRHTPRS